MSLNSAEKLCSMTLKSDAKFEEKRTCGLENYRLKNNDLILESKMAKLDQNKNLKQLDRSDVVRKLCLTLEINE